MGNGMKWGKAQRQDNERRWGTDARDAEAREPAPAQPRTWKKPKGMSMAQARRWADAIAKVYGKPKKTR